MSSSPHRSTSTLPDRGRVPIETGRLFAASSEGMGSINFHWDFGESEKREWNFFFWENMYYIIVGNTCKVDFLRATLRFDDRSRVRARNVLVFLFWRARFCFVLKCGLILDFINNDWYGGDVQDLIMWKDYV